MPSLPPPLAVALLAAAAAIAAAAAAVAAAVASGASPPSPAVSRIAFGSCSKETAPQPVWQPILAFDPQLFIWLGDIVYSDNQRPLSLWGSQRTAGPWRNTPLFFPSEPDELQARYQRAKSHPDYATLRNRAQVIGTWDDHDYGLNDAGNEFPGKKISQKLLLDFLDEPEDSPRRKQEGVYASYLYGSKGKQIKAILLDTRYHRDALFSDGDLLGDSQWKWLENELKGPETEVTIIVSSIQVISNLSATGSPIIFMECWSHFPKEKERLFKLINDCKRSGILFISGDVHFGEIARYDCGVQYPLYDITSSGLNRYLEEGLPKPFPFLLREILWLTHSTMRVFSPNCRYKSCTYAKPNFGAIEIDWNVSPPTIKAEVRDLNGRAVTGVMLSLAELQWSSDSKKLVGSQYQHHCTLERDLPWFIRYRVAIILLTLFTVVLWILAWLLRSIMRLCRRFAPKQKMN